jgi:basic membrane protein A
MLLALLGSSPGVAAEKQLKAGFVYVGPVGDYGWSHAHDVGRKYAEKQLPWLKTVYIESVAEADSARIIDRFIQEEKCDVVFTTSFGYMDDTIKAGMKYPDKHFMHCSGFKQSKMWERTLPISIRPIT